MAPEADDGSEGRLRAACRTAMRHAYAPYSNFPVGAAVLAASGRIYTGANVENASFGLTICAERAAVAAAVGAGERRLVACATTSGRGSSSPCGACRQVLSEFLAPDAPVFFTVDGERHEMAMGRLLPAAFALGGADART